MTPPSHIGRLLRSSTTTFVFGCSVPEPHMPHFGGFVKAPAQRGQSEVVGLIYDIVIQDDPFVRQMVATPDIPETYILDQRQNRQVPIEVSVLAVGYRNSHSPDFYQALPPQPPVTLDCIQPCPAEDVVRFTERFDFLRLILADPTLPGDELVVAALRQAAEMRLAADRAFFMKQAGKELARLLNRELCRLETLLRRIRPA